MSELQGQFSLRSFYLKWDAKAYFFCRPVLKRWKSKVISLHMENKSLWFLFQLGAWAVLGDEPFLRFCGCAKCHHRSQSWLYFSIWSIWGPFRMKDTFLAKCQLFLLLLLLLSQFPKSYPLTRHFQEWHIAAVYWKILFRWFSDANLISIPFVVVLWGMTLLFGGSICPQVKSY